MRGATVQSALPRVVRRLGLRKRGSTHTLRHYVARICRAIRFETSHCKLQPMAQQQGVRLRRLNADHAARYLQWRHRRQRPHRGDPAALDHVLEFLRRKRVLPATKPAPPPRTPAGAWVQAYAQYLREDRGLAEATVTNYAPFIDRLLTDRFGIGPRRAGATRGEPRGWLRPAPGAAPAAEVREAPDHRDAFVFALRPLPRAIHVDLAAVVPCVPNWSQPAMPRGIAPEQVCRLLSHIDRGTAVGRRDYAILLLLARLGLRAGEVIRLELEDIDWADGELARPRQARPPAPPPLAGGSRRGACGLSGHPGTLPPGGSTLDLPQQPIVLTI